ncbi:MAG TPA: NAD-dependent epimerase/dehydratase family protein [Chloroflexota bacterium]|jgi:UDP-glucose 4-epimerase|nr:NAD-dependent epimerase/dehydratase family protein [Chloroflexota bacterium]
MDRALAYYPGKRVAITGGLGFIGSNLARRLVALGSEVLLIDSMVPDYGGNLANIEDIRDRVRINFADIRDAYAMNYLVQGQDIIFNLAGQVSHIDSMRDPYTDLEINCRAQLSLLEACRYYNPSVKVVYASTRQVYGRPLRTPVDETHVARPTDVNGINKLAGESYHIVYNNAYGVRATVLRLTNTYGPRQLMKHNRQGFLPWFVRQVLDDEEIQIYGDGQQRRDFTYVDDVVDAFLLVGCTSHTDGEIYNLGGDSASLLEVVKLLIEIAGRGRYRLVPWPPEKRVIDIGSYEADYRKLTEAVGWRPRTSLADGLREMIRYYEQRRKDYW